MPRNPVSCFQDVKMILFCGHGLFKANNILVREPKEKR